MTAPSIRSYMQIFSRFGLTWHRKVNFSTFSGKLTFQSTRNGPQNLPFCPGSLQDTFIIYSSISHQHIFRTYFANKTNLDNRKSGNLKNPKPRSTNRSPAIGVHPTPRITETGFQRTGVLGNLLGVLGYLMQWRSR